MLDLDIELTEKQQIDLEPLRYVCWTGEGLTALNVIHLGDHHARITAEDPRPETALTLAIAHYIDATPVKIRTCSLIASFLATARMRAQVTSDIDVSYTVLRQLACNYDRSPLGDGARWSALTRLLRDPEVRAAGRVTSTQYRKAIHGRPIPNSTRTVTPSHVALLMHRCDDFRQAVLDEINARPEWLRQQSRRRRTRHRNETQQTGR